MKGKLKQTKGITLIALIITIIVLLILAIVSISLVLNDGILGKAESGVKTYTEEETNEKIQLAYADYQMGKLTDSGYTFEQALQNGKVAYTGVTGSDAEGYIVTTTLSDGTEKKFNVTSTGVRKLKTTVEEYGVKIGDYVAYDEGTGYNTSIETSESGWSSSQTKSTEDLGWRVLGVNEKGELELISDNPTKATLYLKGETGFLKGEGVLNDMCDELYGKGTCACGARSLDVDDINRLGNYDPTTSYDYDSLYQYQLPSGGTDLQFRKSTDKGKAWTDWKKTSGRGSDYQSFRMPGADLSSKISEDNPGMSETLENKWYTYRISRHVKQTTNDGKKMADILSKGDGTEFLDQWLATSVIWPSSFGVDFDMYMLNTAFDSGEYYVYSQVGEALLYGSWGLVSDKLGHIRPVVSLNSDIQIDTTTNDGLSAETAYEIK